MFSSLGDFWNKKSKRRTASKTKLRVESLESRQMLTAVTMTDYEQLILELVNRARMDPAGEVARNSSVSDLNQGLAPGTISSTPKQPLASVQALVDAGVVHAQDMLDRDYFSHYTQGSGDDPTDRAATEGYSGPVGENIAWNGSTGQIDQNTETIQAHDALFLSPSHRQNMMWDLYEEAGMGVRFGPYTSNSITFNAVMVAEEFGYNSGNPYLTGVAFNDGVLADDFYSVGESEAGITITAVSGGGATFTTTTGVSGGFNIKLPAGTYTVTASGGSLAADMVVSDVTISDENVKVDFNTSEAPDPPPQAPAENLDLLGFNTGEEFWVGTSNGSTLDTAYWGDFSSSTTYSDVQVADFNGDGFDDILGRTANGGLVVGISTETPSGRAFTTSTWGSLTNVTDWTIVVGDFNGDGMADLMNRAASDGTFWLAQSTGSGFQNSYWGGLLNSISWTDITAGDYNGDGRTDLVSRAQDGTWWASISTGTSFQNAYWGRWSNAVNWTDVTAGDFNGDGLDDIAGRANNKTWWINRSTGSNFVIEYWGNWTDSVDWVDVTVGDFDGDGNDDIAGRANGQWWIAMSDGDSFTNRYWGYWTTAVSWNDVSLIDINGDGNEDIIGRASNGQWWVFESTGETFQGRLVATWSPGATWQYVGIGNFA